MIAWHILAEEGVEYYERGGDHFDRATGSTARKLTRRLEALVPGDAAAQAKSPRVSETLGVYI